MPSSTCLSAEDFLSSPETFVPSAPTPHRIYHPAQFPYNRSLDVLLEEGTDEAGDGTESIFSSVWDNLPVIARPSDSSMKSFLSTSDHFCSGASEHSMVNPRGIGDLNWLSPSQFISNWDVLSRREQLTFHRLASSEIVRNANQYGTKTRSLSAHLMMSLGADMSNIVNNGADAILTNLKNKSDSMYSQNCLYNRVVDPKTCYRASKAFDNDYNVDALFKMGMVCYHAVITGDKTIQTPEDFLEYRAKVGDFFRSNVKAFVKLTTKQRRVKSFIYSNEISVDSILRQEYRPHTHFTFWIPRNPDIPEQNAAAMDIEARFNEMFTDRRMNVMHRDLKGENVPKYISSYKGLARYINYMYRAYSLDVTYAREIRSDNIREINKASVETYHNLVNIFKACEVHNRTRPTRAGFSYIPLKTELDWKHPGLQPKAKSNTIKKKAAAAKPNKPMPLPTPSAPKVRIPKAPVATTVPKPVQPYANQRATEADLASFPISVPDFMQGGGRLMFQDPAPVAPVAAPTPLVQKQGALLPALQKAAAGLAVGQTAGLGNKPAAPRTTFGSAHHNLPAPTPMKRFTPPPSVKPPDPFNHGSGHITPSSMESRVNPVYSLINDAKAGRSPYDIQKDLAKLSPGEQSMYEQISGNGARQNTQSHMGKADARPQLGLANQVFNQNQATQHYDQIAKMQQGTPTQVATQTPRAVDRSIAAQPPSQAGALDRQTLSLNPAAAQPLGGPLPLRENNLSAFAPQSMSMNPAAAQPIAPKPRAQIAQAGADSVLKAYPQVGVAGSEHNRKFVDAFSADPSQDPAALAHSLFQAAPPRLAAPPTQSADGQLVMPPVKQAEFSDAWVGVFSKLAEEGANEDFLLGMLKGAEDLAVVPELPANRHQVVPGVHNGVTGAGAGALLGTLVSKQMNIRGVGEGVLPALGGVAGAHYFPQLMNYLKDPDGMGVNAVSAAASALNQQPI